MNDPLNNPNVIALHSKILYFETIGAWGMAESLRKILTQMMNRVR